MNTCAFKNSWLYLTENFRKNIWKILSLRLYLDVIERVNRSII